MKRMTLRECIDRVDNLSPNQYSIDEKIAWLYNLDLRILGEVILAHEFNEGERQIESIPVYDTDTLDNELLVGVPHDDLYIAYMQMKIDEGNRETVRYNNSATLFNSYYEDFCKGYNRTHMPITKRTFRIWG